MANWDIDWEPRKIFTYGPTYNTLVTTFRSGAEQRRKKWTSARNRFALAFDSVADVAILDEILRFYEARYGRYDTFTFPNYGQMIGGTRIACNNANPDTITDSSSEFVKKGFVTGGKVTIAGSDSSNDGVYDIHASTAVTASTITLVATAALNEESAYAGIKIYKTYDVRFAADDLHASLVTNSFGTMKTIELIEA